MWTQPDIVRLIDAALDGFAWEFFGAPNYQSLGRKEKIAICRELKAEAASRFAYEWTLLFNTQPTPTGDDQKAETVSQECESPKH